MTIEEKAMKKKEIYCIMCHDIGMSTDGFICDRCSEELETEYEFPTESSRGIDPYDY